MNDSGGIILDDVSAAVGATPLVRLSRLFPRAEVLAKIESMNPGGSTKDRPAGAMLDAALASGELRPGGTVVESSSGNLGLALARGCTVRGLDFVCVVDVRANKATVAAIKALGGRIEMVAEPDPETGDLLTARLLRVERLLEELPGAVNLYQYGNPANPAAHRDGTMREIAEAAGHRLDAVVAACSTTGTIGGCAAYIADHAMDTRVIAVDAVGSALFGGRPGPRGLPGMGAGMVTELSRNVTPDDVVRVTERQCVAGARWLARSEGILAGASTGGVVHALAGLLRERPELRRVAMLVHDGGTPYLDTVYDDDWVRATLGVEPRHLEDDMRELLEATRD
ncbi:pyridoxal-phosphate dependent enzyme [Kocuria coralli]|uniref:Pyridoxal-phosphate dependent enzyme n=1 Tax=Kocuria coralli TaxID=1461025 RepID=A0A5J5KVH2_9MICC|nr:pyridoxal-phosphate dependent enzyme [Kocuria coralli]KAA9393230.1 pyridoxal-phosphate dependent enzyme [Kocuria coralli]